MSPPAWCARYIGLPYADKGRGPDAWDCWGLVRLVLSEQFGAELPSFDDLYWTDIKDVKDLGARVTSAATQFNPVWLDPRGRLPDGIVQTGDVLLMRVDGAPVHVGVVADPSWFLHTEHAQLSCIDQMNGLRWARRIIGAYRHERLGSSKPS